MEEAYYEAALECGDGVEFVESFRKQMTEAFDEEDAFHMYYTSGTTGKAKGAVLSHRIVVAHARAAIDGMP